MKVALIYATYSNGTFSAAQTLKAALEERGHQVNMVLAKDVQVPQLQEADLIVLASPSWDYNGTQGMPHEDYEVFRVTVGTTTFPDKKFAILGLGDSTYTYFCGAVTHLDELVKNLKGTLIHEPLKIDQYYMDEPGNTQKVKDWAIGLMGKLQ